MKQSHITLLSMSYIQANKLYPDYSERATIGWETDHVTGYMSLATDVIWFWPHVQYHSDDMFSIIRMTCSVSSGWHVQYHHFTLIRNIFLFIKDVLLLQVIKLVLFTKSDIPYSEHCTKSMQFLIRFFTSSELAIDQATEWASHGIELGTRPW